MKRILIPALCAAMAMSGCSKSSTDLQAPSKVDVLLTQLKAEPLFTEYLMHVQNASDAINADVSKLDYTDTAIARAKNLSYDEKAKQLHFAHSAQTVDEMKVANTLIMTLIRKYPEIATLTNEESKLLYKKAVANYLQTKKKSK